MTISNLLNKQTTILTTKNSYGLWLDLEATKQAVKEHGYSKLVPIQALVLDLPKANFIGEVTEAVINKYGTEDQPIYEIEIHDGKEYGGFGYVDYEDEPVFIHSTDPEARMIINFKIDNHTLVTKLKPLVPTLV